MTGMPAGPALGGAAVGLLGFSLTMAVDAAAKPYTRSCLPWVPPVARSQDGEGGRR